MNSWWSARAPIATIWPVPPAYSNATPANEAQPPGLGGRAIDDVDREVAEDGHTVDELWPHRSSSPALRRRAESP